MKNSRKYIYFIAIAIIVILYFIIRGNGYNESKDLLGDFSTIFTSIILEGIPFILLGSFISAIIQIYVPDEKITSIIPEKSILGYVGAALAGFIFPICECAIIPITRGLLRKGLPLGVGITFMMAVPIVNPVVIMSTYYAFYDKPGMVIARTGGGFACAIIIGILADTFGSKNDCLNNNLSEEDFYCSCGCNVPVSGQSKIRVLIEHTNREFLDITRFLIFGAFISSLFQTAQSIGYFQFIGKNQIIQIIFMMFLGFALSLCSEADAFVGRSFLTQYSFSSIVGFLILGAMIDFKNLVMLYGTFNKKFVGKLAVTITATVFTACMIFMITAIQ